MAEDPKRTWSIGLLALTLWREARGQHRAAIEAVACSIMNRVARPSWWGSTVAEVLSKKWQYSSLTDPHDPQLTLWPAVDGVFLSCLEIARLAIDGQIKNAVPGADSYHDTSIAPPAWTKAARRVGQVGAFIFYDTDHDYERKALAEAA
ncbi:cell wall hydrolase [Anaeromyxobacter oryzisoli]|uniref:cell wall hydrolase n=1 Tax=Anaeromyxobacter oryzisoli TaxID=2925408 RepID=UPI001F5962BF|nr:cell wall hydrolase [Anaeromyxobacter sp. SG63]